LKPPQPVVAEYALRFEINDHHGGLCPLIRAATVRAVEGPILTIRGRRASSRDGDAGQVGRVPILPRCRQAGIDLLTPFNP
jgi:hypothetical protein